MLTGRVCKRGPSSVSGQLFIVIIEGTVLLSENVSDLLLKSLSSDGSQVNGHQRGVGDSLSPNAQGRGPQ